MDFVSMKERDEALGIVDNHLLADIMVLNNLEIPISSLTVYGNNLKSQCFEFAKNMGWNPDEITVFHSDFNPVTEMYRILVVLKDWNYLKNVIIKTIKMRAFL